MVILLCCCASSDSPRPFDQKRLPVRNMEGLVRVCDTCAVVKYNIQDLIK
jgi:hypothetical protein